MSSYPDSGGRFIQCATSGCFVNGTFIFFDGLFILSNWDSDLLYCTNTMGKGSRTESESVGTCHAIIYCRHRVWKPSLNPSPSPAVPNLPIKVSTTI